MKKRVLLFCMFFFLFSCSTINGPVTENIKLLRYTTPCVKTYFINMIKAKAKTLKGLGYNDQQISDSLQIFVYLEQLKFVGRYEDIRRLEKRWNCD